jgi:small multidrug resistance family-3 protein
MRTFLLYAVTALAEILGCYLFYLMLREGRSNWLSVPALASLLAFAWLLTLHPAASGRVYAAYGGVYVVAALLWLWAVDGIRPSGWDAAGGALCLLGMAVIVMQPK